MWIMSKSDTRFGNIEIEIYIVLMQLLVSIAKRFIVTVCCVSSRAQGIFNVNSFKLRAGVIKTKHNEIIGEWTDTIAIDVYISFGVIIIAKSCGYCDNKTLCTDVNNIKIDFAQ